MIIHWEGRDWPYSDRKNPVSRCITIKESTGLLYPVDFAVAVARMDPHAVRALMWLVRTQNGDETPLEAVDGSLVDFVDAYGAAYEAEQAPDPQTPAPVGGSETTTSQPSEMST